MPGRARLGVGGAVTLVQETMIAASPVLAAVGAVIAVEVRRLIRAMREYYS